VRGARGQCGAKGSSGRLILIQPSLDAHFDVDQLAALYPVKLLLQSLSACIQSPSKAAAFPLSGCMP